MCENAHLPTNEFSDLITPLPASYARLCRNQTQPGYCVVISKAHVSEPFELAPADAAQFWADVTVVGAAVNDAFHPRKIDYLVMGHRLPHLHCHVYTQYEWNDPFRLIDISEGDTALAADAWAERIELLRACVTTRLDEARSS